MKLRPELAAYNATAECLDFKFAHTSEGQFVKTVIAAQGQLVRLQNRRQILQKMKVRVERGTTCSPFRSATATRRSALTAGWAKCRRSHYPFYFCPKRGCDDYGQTVRRETLEAQFEAIVQRLQPS